MKRDRKPGSGKGSRTDSGRDLRRLLIDAALRILDDPETPLELRKVAEAADKSRTAPYLVFGKESEGGGLSALRLAVAAEGAEMLAERMREAGESAEDPRLAFHRVAWALFEFATSHERLFRLMFGPEIGTIPLTDDAGRHPEFANLVDARMKAERVVHDVMRDAQAERVLPEGDSIRHTIAAWALLIGIAFLLLDRVLGAVGVETSVEQGADLAVEVLMGAGTESLTRAALALMAVQEAKEGKAASMPPSGPTPMEDEPELRLRRSGLFGFGAGRGRGKRESEEADPGDALWGETPSDETTSDDEPASDNPPEDVSGGTWSLSASSGPSSASWSRADASDGSSTRLDDAARIYEAASETISSYPSLRRAARMGPALKGAKILWVDDHPRGVAWERRALEELGVVVLPAWSTQVALERLGEEPFDLVISDIARGEDLGEGVRALDDLRRVAPGIPVVFYVARVDPTRGPPPGSVGITNQIDELLHLVLDVLERRRL